MGCWWRDIKYERRKGHTTEEDATKRGIRCHHGVPRRGHNLLIFLHTWLWETLAHCAFFTIFLFLIGRWLCFAVGFLLSADCVCFATGFLLGTDYVLLLASSWALIMFYCWCPLGRWLRFAVGFLLGVGCILLSVSSLGLCRWFPPWALTAICCWFPSGRGPCFAVGFRPPGCWLRFVVGFLLDAGCVLLLVSSWVLDVLCRWLPRGRWLVGLLLAGRWLCFTVGFLWLFLPLVSSWALTAFYRWFPLGSWLRFVVGFLLGADCVLPLDGHWLHAAFCRWFPPDCWHLNIILCYSARVFSFSLTPTTRFVHTYVCILPSGTHINFPIYINFKQSVTGYADPSCLKIPVCKALG